MRLSWPRYLRIGVCLLFLFSIFAVHAQIHQVPANDTFDQQAFSYELRELERRESHTIYAISFPSPMVTALASNNTVHGEFYLPHGLPANKSYPAAIINHILAGNFDLERMMCTALANNGVVAMFIMMPYYDRRGDGKGRKQMLESPEHFIKAIDQAVLDNRRAVDVMRARKEVAIDKVGVGGGSLGAIMSATVCGFEPRLERAFLLLGGGNLEKIFRHESRETAAFRRFLDAQDDATRAATLAELKRVDPLSHGEALRKLSRISRLRMICASEDQVIPPECSRELAKAAKATITWLPGVNHYSVISQSAYIFAELIDFFTVRRPADWKSPAAAEGYNPEAIGLQLLGKMARDLSMMLSAPPTPGNSIKVKFNLAVEIDRQKHQAVVNWQRGSLGRYFLEANIPKLGQGTFGQGAEYPWIAGAKESLFVGSLNAERGRRFTDFLAMEQMLKVQLGVGTLASVAMAPEMISSYTRVAATPLEQGMRVVVDVPHHRFNGQVNIVFNPQGEPSSCFFSLGDLQGTIVFEEWALQAKENEQKYEPPTNKNAKPVNQEDVLRMVAAVFERLLEMIDI